MATAKRRMMLSLSPELDAAIDRLAKAQDRPRASVVVEILDQMVPSINTLSEVLEASKAAPIHAYNKLFGMLATAMSQGGAIGHAMVSELEAAASKEGRHD